MIDDDKPYDQAEGVFCYYIGLMIVEFPQHEQNNFHLLNDCLTEMSDKLEFLKNSLSHNVWQVRCKADNANDATELLKEFIGRCLLNKDVKSINLNCQFSLEWLNYSDIGQDVNNTIDSYIIGHGVYTLDSLLKNTAPRLLQWSDSGWRYLD